MQTMPNSPHGCIFLLVLCYILNNVQKNFKEALRLRELGEKRYTDEGLLIVSELDGCQLFERDESSPKLCSHDCFFCKFSEFRQREYIEKTEEKMSRGILFSVCHNEKNKKIDK